MLDPALLPRALGDAVRKLNPLTLLRNPVIFVTEVVSILVTLLALRAALGVGPQDPDRASAHLEGLVEHARPGGTDFPYLSHTSSMPG